MLKTQIPRSFRTLLLAVSIEPQEIGKRIRAARERRGWTQMDFANEAHVSMSSVQRWERGDLPPVRELIRLSGVLGVDPEQLVELEPTGEDQLSALRGELVEVTTVPGPAGDDVGRDPRQARATSVSIFRLTSARTATSATSISSSSSIVAPSFKWPAGSNHRSPIGL